MLHRSGFPNAANAFAGSSPLPPGTGAADCVTVVTAPSGPGGVAGSLMQAFYPIPLLPDNPDLDPFWRRLDPLSFKLAPQTFDVGANRRAFDSQTLDLGAKRREIDPPSLDVGEIRREFDHFPFNFPPQKAVFEPQIVQFLAFSVHSPGRATVTRPSSRTPQQSFDEVWHLG